MDDKPLKMPSDWPDAGQRALPTFKEPQPNCILFRVPDGMHAPHLREGEVAVVDLTLRDIVHGELFLIWSKCYVVLWQINRYRMGASEGAEPCYFLSPLDKPGEDWFEKPRSGRPVYLSDGPLDASLLAPRIVGQVVGVLDRPWLHYRLGPSHSRPEA